MITSPSHRSSYPALEFLFEPGLFTLQHLDLELHRPASHLELDRGGDQILPPVFQRRQMFPRRFLREERHRPVQRGAVGVSAMEPFTRRASVPRELT